MKNLKKDLSIFTLGGVVYSLIEILWRRRTHWTMAITGGVCFLSLYKFYKHNKLMELYKKCVCGSVIITAIEFICGCIVNLKLKMNVWDYKNCKFNVKGQICPLYSFLWGLLCLPVSMLCKYMSNNER
ncbi:MAG: putative ABC transporter permease [Ruminococcus sp.]|nr:putative ABC transporter permease [Ruminococcus sp.]